MTRTTTARLPVLKLEVMALPLLKEATQLMSLCMTGTVTALFVSKKINLCLKYSVKLVNSRTNFKTARKESAGG